MQLKQKKICAAYGVGAVNDRTCQKWFVKFYSFMLEVSRWTMPYGQVE